MSQPPCHPLPNPKKTRGPASPQNGGPGDSSRPRVTGQLRLSPPAPLRLVAINRNPPPAVPSQRQLYRKATVSRPRPLRPPLHPFSVPKPKENPTPSMIKPPPFAPTPPPFPSFPIISIFPAFMRPNHCPTRLRVFGLFSFLTIDFPNVARISSSPPHAPKYFQTRMLPKKKLVRNCRIKHKLDRDATDRPLLARSQDCGLWGVWKRPHLLFSPGTWITRATVE